MGPICDLLIKIRKISDILLLIHVDFFFFSSFKLFLELEPQLRDIIHKFYESNYASCLKLLEEIKVRSWATGSSYIHIYSLWYL